jgi:hypothetical protein
LETFLKGVQRKGRPAVSLLENFTQCCVKRGDIKLIAAAVLTIDDALLLTTVFDRLVHVLRDSKLAYSYEKEWASGIERILQADTVPQEKKRKYNEEFGGMLDAFRRRKGVKVGMRADDN